MLARLARLGAVLVLSLAAVLAGTVSADAAQQSGARTSGWNDNDCKPGAEHPEPVILVHGMFANDRVNFATIAPALSNAGYCVFSTTYGAGPLGPFIGGLDPLAGSAGALGQYVDRIREQTGAGKVDLVGHSEGSTVPAYYMKMLGGAAKVKHYVGFGANYRGTTLHGLGTLAKKLGIDKPLADIGCGACHDFLPGSQFLEDLGKGGIAVPGPTYTNIVSKIDEVVTPYTSGLIDAPNSTNVVLQDRCPSDAAGHLGQAIDPNVLDEIERSLDPAHAGPPKCTPFPGFGI
ncbi:lipase family alpha/beta hydrolase [Sciscionella marina]|uniref:lipase family alpha/beta hydrolase n=1 Tax=Sciscionella marina TaxID=508770 RepID=UPI00037B776E|nr:alpha/beta fold hydrolase [Sciscionella marina]